MGVIVQTRFNTTYTTAIDSVQTTMDVADVPLRTVGYLTIRRLYSDLEDIKYQGVSGLTLTGLLRGLSPTALTDTEVVGLKKSHDINSPSSTNTVEMTNLHYVINNKPNKDDPEEITGVWTFSSGLSLAEIFDENLNSILTFGVTASAVNNIKITNAATGNSPTISVEGTDTNIGLEMLIKGTGKLIIPDGSQTKTTAAPVAPADIANKAYVDATIASPVDQYWPTNILYGETLVVGDLVKWDGITPTGSRWVKAIGTSTYDKTRLGIVMQDGTTGQTGLVLRKGLITGQNFAPFTPVISSNGTGGSRAIGNAAASTMVALYVANNNMDIDMLSSTPTISLRRVGTPTADLKVYLAFANGGTTTIKPAARVDYSTGLTAVGAIFATATIDDSAFSGIFQDIPINFTYVTRYLPSNTGFFILLKMDGAVDGSNYYEVQVDGSSPAFPSVLTLDIASQPPQTWNAQTGVAKYDLGIAQQDPIGHPIKMSVLNTGTYGLSAGTLAGNWSRIIGKVVDATSFFFDPESYQGLSEVEYSSLYYNGNNYGLAVTSFTEMPNRLAITTGIAYDTTTDYTISKVGTISGYMADPGVDITGGVVMNGDRGSSLDIAFAQSLYDANQIGPASSGQLPYGPLFLQNEPNYQLKAIRTLLSANPSFPVYPSAAGVIFYLKTAENAYQAVNPIRVSLSITAT